MSIRLIAADMDGTLLDSRKQLPEGLFPLVRALHERGVRFAPASGRQFYTLYEQFGEIADELMYISENGAMICDGAECVGFSAIFLSYNSKRHTGIPCFINKFLGLTFNLSANRTFFHEYEKAIVRFPWSSEINVIDEILL